MHEVVDGGAFAQKFWIAGDVEMDRPAGQQCNLITDPGPRADGNGALLHDQPVFGEKRRDRLRHCDHSAQIGLAIFPRRSSDG